MTDRINLDDYVLKPGSENTDIRGSFMDDLYGGTKKFVAEHPGETAVGTAVIAGAIWLATRGRGGALTNEFKAGQGALRTFEGEAIPNIARPGLQANALKNGEEAFQTAVTTAKSGYKADLAEMMKTPGQITTVKGEVILNPTEEQLVKAATDLQFKHVPQLGQFLKGTGQITEHQIESALQIQRAIPADQPRKFLGQILVENNLAKQADVDLAFARQTEMKKQLKEVFDQFRRTGL